MKHDKHHCCPSQHRHTREVNMFEKGTVIKPSYTCLSANFSQDDLSKLMNC